jgi:hypothetical protein
VAQEKRRTKKENRVALRRLEHIVEHHLRVVLGTAYVACYTRADSNVGCYMSPRMEQGMGRSSMTSTASYRACMALVIPGGAAPAGREEQHDECVPYRLELVFGDSAKCTALEETAGEWLSEGYNASIGVEALLTSMVVDI